MRKFMLFLLVLLTLLAAGCTDRHAVHPEAPTIPEPTKPFVEASAADGADVTYTEPVETAPPEEVYDTVTDATSTVSEGMCIVCGSFQGDYDGYCYYCHPSFGFTCIKCGYSQPYHRPESGLCYNCDTAETILPEDTYDTVTDATPAVSEGMCIVCGSFQGDYDGYCYYCHPSFGFTCAKCGYAQPYHRPESGLCYNCETEN